MKSDILVRMQAKLGYYNSQSELTAFYHEILAYQKRADENVPNQSVILIGDSLIEGLAVTAVSPLAVNYGIGQDTTVGVLNRIASYQSIEFARCVVIAIGINDVKRRSNDEIVRNYEAILEKIPKHVPVVLSAILPIDEKILNITAYQNSNIANLNDKLKLICAKESRCYYLDITPFIKNTSHNLAIEYHIGDGIHLNKRGNQVWIRELKQIISSIN